MEAAYNQLLEEGYIRSREKIGYFVEQIHQSPPKNAVSAPKEAEETPFTLDLTGSGSENFPFSVWTKLQREVILDYGDRLLLPLPNQGIPELRSAIAQHLADFRGMHVAPENILIGAGTDFLYNLLIQLLGRDMTYAVEEPGYGKIRQIYAAGGVRCIGVPLDGEGVMPDRLQDARVLHLSPAHHFPTGLITSVRRRQELLNWAVNADGYIIEDDYDSEFRFDAHPKPTMYSLDHSGRVVYMNTFSKSLAPSIRISYLVLPTALMQQFRAQLGFYSCTVSSFEQHTLARFLTRGHFEKHINRMRKFYRNRRNRVVAALQSCAFAEKLTIREQDAGLHFLLQVDTPLSDAALTALLAESGIRIRALSEYYHGPVPENVLHHLVVNYSGIQDDTLEEVLKRINK